jgi:hypothetical protein
MNARNGRPFAEPKPPGTRVTLGHRVTPEAKARLEALCEQTGRSMSQEVENRLEQSFLYDAAFPSPELRMWSVIVARKFQQAGQAQAMATGIDRQAWMQDARCMKGATVAVISHLLRDLILVDGVGVGDVREAVRLISKELD